MRLLTPLLAATALAAVSSAQIKTIASETFEYPQGDNLGQKSGGFGWENAWWSGGTDDHAKITSPGFDEFGYRATINVGEGGNYRTIDPTAWPQSTDSAGKFGLDGQIIWITVEQQRMNGGDDAWGGFSLFNKGGTPGEVLFIGAPFQFNQWGFDGLGIGGAAPTSTPTIDTKVKMVLRIDFAAGVERIRLWIDPPVDHPTTTPDLDYQGYPDFIFNEVRIDSGPGATAGMISGWHFDSLLIECEGCPDGPTPPPPGTPNSLYGGPTEISVAGGGSQTLQMDAGSTYANMLYLVVGTLSGTAPGIPVDGLILPLNIDPYLLHTAANPNSPPLFPSFSVLDASGQAQCTFTLPAAGNPAWVGAHFDHAFAVIDTGTGIPVIPFISNAWGLDLIP
jgi:hypothetical protein